MVDLKSLQGVFFTIYSKQILVGFSQPVRLTTNVNINFLYDFLGDLYDDLFYNLLNFCFFFLGPVRLYHLLDKIIIVFRKLWTNVIVDATFGFKSFNHVPFSWLYLEHVNHSLNLFLAVSSAAQESCFLGHGNFILDELDGGKGLIVELVELFVDLEIEWFLFEDGFDDVMAVFDGGGVPAFEDFDFLHLIDEFLEFGFEDGFEFFDEIAFGFFDGGAGFFVGLFFHLSGFLLILVIDFADLVEDVVVNFIDIGVSHGVFFFLIQRLNNDFWESKLIKSYYALYCIRRAKIVIKVLYSMKRLSK